METVFLDSSGLSVCPANKFEVLTWPLTSPDLNPQDLWDVLDNLCKSSV